MVVYLETCPQDCIEFSKPVNVSASNLKLRNGKSKAVFFFLNEGIRSTFDKYRAIKLSESTEKEQAIIVCSFRISDRRYIGVGRQLCKNAIKKFHPGMVFEVKDDCEFSLAEFKLSDNGYKRVYSYIPVDECVLDDEIPEIILLENKKLKRAILRIPDEHTWKPLLDVKKNNRRFFMYGFGMYPQVFVSKHFKNRINSVIDYNPNAVMSFKWRDSVSYFQYYKDSLPYYREIEDPVAVIATYHSSHFEIARALFDSNPNGKIFIEKPIVVNHRDAIALIHMKKNGLWVEGGYNRRYIDWNRDVKRMMKMVSSPKIINISVKEVIIPETHWYFWKNQGTRITGNICHWIDLAYYWIKCKPTEMCLLNRVDSIILSIKFIDGSLVSIAASDIGNSLRGVQEKIEIRVEDLTVFIDDYQRMMIHERGKTVVHRKLVRRKGHDRMYKEFVAAIDKDDDPKYEDDDILWVSYMVETASDMLVNNRKYHKIDVDYADVGSL